MHSGCMKIQLVHSTMSFYGVMNERRSWFHLSSATTNNNFQTNKKYLNLCTGNIRNVHRLCYNNNLIKFYFSIFIFSFHFIIKPHLKTVGENLLNDYKYCTTKDNKVSENRVSLTRDYQVLIQGREILGKEAHETFQRSLKGLIYINPILLTETAKLSATKEIAVN